MAKGGGGCPTAARSVGPPDEWRVVGACLRAVRARFLAAAPCLRGLGAHQSVCTSRQRHWMAHASCAKWLEADSLGYAAMPTMKGPEAEAGGLGGRTGMGNRVRPSGQGPGARGGGGRLSEG